MKSIERTKGLLKSPKLSWDVLVRGRYDFIYDQIPFQMENMTLKKRVNLFLAGANLVYRKLSAWSMPLHMQMELTNYCNLRCPVCPTGLKAVKRKPEFMDVDLFKRVIDEVGPYLLTTSLWGWGEPLLHPNLKQILSAIGKHKIASLLSTNGQKLNDERVIDALTCSPPTHLIVAIDGLTDHTNSKFRVGASLEPILSGVRKIARIKKERNQLLPVIHMRFIVMKHNQHEVPGIIAFAKKNNFDFLTIRTLSIIDVESSNRTHQTLIPDRSEFQAYEYEDGKRYKRNDYVCQEPFWFPTLFSDGTLVPCEQDYNAQQALGVISSNVLFKDLWFSKKAKGVRKSIRDNWQSVSFCQNCPYRDRDGTDVSIEAHFINPDIGTPNII